jgi:hypothetical protein
MTGLQLGGVVEAVSQTSAASLALLSLSTLSIKQIPKEIMKNGAANSQVITPHQSNIIFNISSFHGLYHRACD